MENARQAQPQSDFDAGPLLNMYLSSIDSWKKNYDALVPINDGRSGQTKGSGQLTSSFDDALIAWQKTGAEFFRRTVEQQIELCRFFGKRWEQYLELPSGLSHCQCGVDIAQLQVAFLTKMAADYGTEGQRLAQNIQVLGSSGNTAQPVSLVEKSSQHH